MDRSARVRMSFIGLAAALIISGGIVMAHASMVAAPAGADAIKPFHVHVSDETLADLKRRVAATRWPDKESVRLREADVRTASPQWHFDAATFDRSAKAFDNPDHVSLVMHN